MITTDEISCSSDQQIRLSPKAQFSVWHTFKHHLSRFIITVIIDIILPLVIYFVLQRYIKPVYALLAAGTPPLFMVIFKGLFFCTFDALGFFVFITFLISAVVAIVSRNPIILLLEKSLVTGIISIVLAITLIPFHFCRSQCRLYPFAYYMYLDLVPIKRTDVGLPDNIFNNEQEQINDQYMQLREDSTLGKIISDKEEAARVYEWIYRNCRSFRLACYMITGIWSVGFLLEFLARLFLILMHLSVNKIVIYGHIMLSTITVVCIVLTIVCIANERKRTLLAIEDWCAKDRVKRSVESGTLFAASQCNSSPILNVNI